jgi:HEAT repeat protein
LPKQREPVIAPDTEASPKQAISTPEEIRAAIEKILAGYKPGAGDDTIIQPIVALGPYAIPELVNYFSNISEPWEIRFLVKKALWKLARQTSYYLYNPDKAQEKGYNLSEGTREILVQASHKLVDLAKNGCLDNSDVVTALGCLACSDKKVSDFLFGIIEDESLHGGQWGVRDTTVCALRDIADRAGPNPDWFDRLYDYLTKDELKLPWRTRYTVPGIIAKFGDRKAIPALIDALKNDRFDRESVIRALADLKAQESVPDIAVSLDLEIPVEILGKYEKQISSPGPLKGDFGKVSNQRNKYLQAEGWAKSAAAALAQIGGSEAKNKLLLAKDSLIEKDCLNTSLGAEILGALAKLGEKTALEEMTDMLNPATEMKTPKTLHFDKERIGKLLEKATGRKYGTDYKKWKEYLERQRK